MDYLNWLELIIFLKKNLKTFFEEFFYVKLNFYRIILILVDILDLPSKLQINFF